MARPSTVPVLITVVRKSELIESPRLEAYLQRNPENTVEPQTFMDQLVADGLLTAFQGKHLLEGRYKGLILGSYKLLDMIGKGAHSLVFLAEHFRLHRKVAVKVLPQHLAKKHLELERFQREARAVAVLDHPNIVRAHDISHWGQTHFLVMEYVEGKSLEQHVQANGPLPYAEAAGYVIQVAQGLQHAYEAGLVHRDIKPANLLLSKQGVVKILDMGLARFFDDDDNFTQMYCKDAVLGTADYIAPEQALDSHIADIRSDLYSLGATFYRLVTGRTPFGGSWVRQKLMAHQLWDPEPLHTVRPDVPEELSAIVAKMMAKKPEDRYQTPMEVIAAFEPWTRPQAKQIVKVDANFSAKAKQRQSWFRWAWAAALLVIFRR